jgi:Gly-Xaa carboxypeptidase
MPPALKYAIQSARTDEEQATLAETLASVLGLRHRYFMQTSQAATLLHSGNKVNNLPEFGFAVINHRIAVEETVESVMSTLVERVASKARELGLGLYLWGEEVRKPDSADLGILSVETEGAIEPAPLAPRDSGPWKLLAGTIRHVWNGRFEEGPESEIIVSPAMSTGNTDTQVNVSLTMTLGLVAFSADIGFPLSSTGVSRRTFIVSCPSGNFRAMPCTL